MMHGIKKTKTTHNTQIHGIVQRNIRFVLTMVNAPDYQQGLREDKKRRDLRKAISKIVHYSKKNGMDGFHQSKELIESTMSKVKHDLSSTAFDWFDRTMSGHYQMIREETFRRYGVTRWNDPKITREMLTKIVEENKKVLIERAKEICTNQ